MVWGCLFIKEDLDEPESTLPKPGGSGIFLDVHSGTSPSGGRGSWVLVSVLHGAVYPVCRQGVPKLVSCPELSIPVQSLTSRATDRLGLWPDLLHVDTGPELTCKER